MAVGLLLKWIVHHQIHCVGVEAQKMVYYLIGVVLLLKCVVHHLIDCSLTCISALNKSQLIWYLVDDLFASVSVTSSGHPVSSIFMSWSLTFEIVFFSGCSVLSTTLGASIFPFVMSESLGWCK